MEKNLTNIPVYDLQLAHDYQRENKCIDTGDGCFPVKTMEDEYMPKSATGNGKDDQKDTCFINRPGNISRDIWTLENSGKPNSIEENHSGEENIAYDSTQQPQLQSQLNIEEERDEMRPLYVCDFKLKPELVNDYLLYTGQMRDTKPAIDQKLSNLKTCYMDPEQVISSSLVRMNHEEHFDECDKPYEQIYMKPVQAISEVEVINDLSHALKSKVVSNIRMNERPALHGQVLNKVMSKCFVRLKRLNPGYIKENTQPRSSAPDLPDLLPEGLCINLTDTGVWSTRFFPKGTKFGPYDHSAVSSDSSDGRLGWTSSVRKSSEDNGHNMEVEQLGSTVSYKIVTDIQPQTELILLEFKPNNKIDHREKDYEMSCQQLDSSVITEQKLSSKKCGKLLCHSGNLNNHMKSHARSYKCSECGKLFPDSRGLKRHMLTHTKEKPFQCIECGKECTQKYNLVTHMLIHSGEKPHECKQCGKFFSRSGGLKEHMVTHAGVKTYKCSKCGMLFSYRSSMKRHMLTHTKEKPFQCIDCGKEFAIKANLVRHMLTHSGEKSYECKRCGKFFSRTATLKQHMSSHTGVKSHKCSECGKLFSNSSHMKSHMLTHTKEKAFQCIECGNKFTRKHHLVSHMLTHSGEKSHECKQCGKFFSLSTSLKVHMESHTGVKNHKCNECGKLFSAHRSMKRHMLTHTKEKAFRCIECGTKFTQKPYLVKHMLTHSGEKPHECKQCGKFFSLSGHLKQHMTTHTGIKSHKCSECGKLFYLRGHMKTHMASHTKERAFLFIVNSQQHAETHDESYKMERCSNVNNLETSFVARKPEEAYE